MASKGKGKKWKDDDDKSDVSSSDSDTEPETEETQETIRTDAKVAGEMSVKMEQHMKSLRFLYPDIDSYNLSPLILAILARLANGKADVPDLEMFEGLTYDEEGVPNLDEWDPDSMILDETVVVYGKRRSGKSVFVKGLMYHLKDRIPMVKVFSETENKNHWYRDFVPEKYIEYEFDDKKLAEVLAFQTMIMEMPDYEEQVEEDENYCRMVVVLDDVIKDRHTLSFSPALMKCFTNGRHFRLLPIIPLQYDKAIPPGMRNNIDLGVIFRTKAMATRKSLHELFGADLDYTLFLKLLNKYTKNHMVLICNTADAQEIRINKTFFWYLTDKKHVKKAGKGKHSFYFGHPELWKDAQTLDPMIMKAENQL